MTVSNPPGPTARADRGAAGAREPSDRIIAEFLAGLRELRCIGSERLLEHGISLGHFHVMSVLDRHGDLTMSRLADVIGVGLSNATGIVDRMEERGVVERHRDPEDRRVVLVRITDEGRRILGEAEVLREDLLRAVLDRLDERQRRAVATAVAALRVALAAELAAGDSTSIWHAHVRSAHHAEKATVGR